MSVFTMNSAVRKHNESSNQTVIFIAAQVAAATARTTNSIKATQLDNCLQYNTSVGLLEQIMFQLVHISAIQKQRSSKI